MGIAKEWFGDVATQMQYKNIVETKIVQVHALGVRVVVGLDGGGTVGGNGTGVVTEQNNLCP